MQMPNIINHMIRKSGNFPSGPGKISEFLLFNPQLSISSRITAIEPIRNWLSFLQKFSSHTILEYLDRTKPPLASTSSLQSSSVNPNPYWTNNSNPPTMITPRGSTPIGRQFESWIKSLQPGFKPQDVAHVLEQQTDPDLAYDIFKWTAQQRNYRHNHQTYQIMIETLACGRRRNPMERLMEEVMAGACTGSLLLFNTIIYNYCGLRMLGPAINAYKKMKRLQDCKPDVKTYNMLLNAIVRRFSTFTVCCVHLRTVKSLSQQMNADGVEPDIVTLNLLIKAHSRAREMDEALRFYREMGLYGCSPNVYTFNYMIRGFCEKGWVKQALEFYDIMLGKGFCPTRGVYNVFICSLSVEGKVEEAAKALRDMTDNGLVPDFLAYRTLVDKLCSTGKGGEAYELLHGLREKGGVLDEKTYKRLVNSFNLIQEE